MTDHKEIPNPKSQRTGEDIMNEGDSRLREMIIEQVLNGTIDRQSVDCPNCGRELTPSPYRWHLDEDGNWWIIRPIVCRGFKSSCGDYTQRIPVEIPLVQTDGLKVSDVSPSWKPRWKRTTSIEVPPFKQYYPSKEDMTHEQRIFYITLEDKMDSGEYPSVDGHISYLFVYAYQLVANWYRWGFEKLHYSLLELAEAYYDEDKFSPTCKKWSFDCLLGLENYDKFLDLTEPVDMFKSHKKGNLGYMRCCVSQHIGKTPRSVDLYTLTKYSPTKFTIKNQPLFRDILEDVFAEIAEKKGPWMDTIVKLHNLWVDMMVTSSTSSFSPEEMRKLTIKGEIYELFWPAPFEIGHHPKTRILTFRHQHSLGSKEFQDLLQETIREAENRLRELKGVPRVGEGWIAETALYQAVASAFPHTDVIHHGRPEWLRRQHLDIWVPEWSIAVEYQGTQHFEPVEHFGGEKGFETTTERDARKKRLCVEHKVTLIMATENDTHQEVIESIKQVLE